MRGVCGLFEETRLAGVAVKPTSTGVLLSMMSTSLPRRLVNVSRVEANAVRSCAVGENIRRHFCEKSGDHRSKNGGCASSGAAPVTRLLSMRTGGPFDLLLMLVVFRLP